MRNGIFNRGIKNKLKHPLDIGIGNLAVAHTITHLINNVPPLDLHKTGAFGEGDKVIFECAAVAFRKIDSKRDYGKKML